MSAALALPAPPADPASDDAAWLAEVFAPEALGARWQPVRELGRGAMGIVVLARDRQLHRVVALKLLHPLLASSTRARERFRREARIQAGLAHPGIVPVLGYDEQTLDDGRVVPWFAMPYVAGESLGARLRRDRTLPPSEVRRLLRALLDALAYAHGAGVVHRDLKPENVLLEAGTGRVLLTDFGVAALPSHDDPRATEHSAGTPLWMAPEQFAGEHAIDGRTDLYALGAMAYAMLAGRAPHAGRSARAIAVALFTEEVPRLAPLARGADRALVAAVERCLARDPAARWPSAAAMRADLAAEHPVARSGRAAWDAVRAAFAFLPRQTSLL